MSKYIALIFRSICLFLVLLAVLAGICDWYFEKFEKTPPPAVVLAVTAFSLRSNLKQVFHISRKTVPGQVPCLHGLRVFSIAWVVLGHRYETFSYGMPHINSFEALQVRLLFLRDNYQILMIITGTTTI